MGDPFLDLLTAAKNVARLVAVDCLYVPTRHESTCQCEPHIAVRKACDEMDTVIQRIEQS